MATLSNNREFTSQQAQLLQDIAHNGSHHEDNDDDDDAFKDLDPAILLQSLADFQHPASHSEPKPRIVSESSASTSHHFESLLQAVASADGEQSAEANQGQQQSKLTAPSPVNSLSNLPKNTSTKRKRRELEYEYDDDDELAFGFIKPSKSNKKQRKKQATAESKKQAAAVQLAREREIWRSQSAREGDGDGDGTAETRASIRGKDARGTGGHSAVALFRAPTAASKKYTRLPMATVYTQLEVNPDLFLRLQAAAKKFMLDPDHPERAECVGNKGKGDTDMTKLKLFGCVGSFLEDGGWGEKCWGETAPPLDSRAHRNLRWPESKNKIITTVTPLMRRMVTNERQRIYALEARASKKSRGGDRREISPTPAEEETLRAAGERMRAPSPSQYPTVDLNSYQYHYNVNESAMAQQTSMPRFQTNSLEPASSGLSPGADDGSSKYSINIMQNGRRSKPKVTLTQASCPNYSSLFQHTLRVIEDENVKFISIMVLGPGYWLHVGNEGEWRRAIAVVEENEILDGEIRCAVELGEVEQE